MFTIENQLELKKFVVPEVITGENASLLVGRYLKYFSSEKPLIVTDKQVRSYQWFEEIISVIDNQVNDFAIFDDLTENPKDYEIMLGAEFFLKNECDLIIAIGGGSPIDCAKAISIVSTNGGHILDYIGVDQINLPGPPLICIPTTAGTGADVSQFAIIADSKNEIKKAIISKKVVPDLALVDPIPLKTLSSELIAVTGMDALTHAIEAYVSNAQSALTDVHAVQSIKLISENIKNAYGEQASLLDLNGLMLGSLHAGIAFSNASLGAVHALAHSLGGALDLPHGKCNSILLCHVIDFNYDYASKRYNEIAKMIGIEANKDSIKEALIDYIKDLTLALGIPEQFELESIDKSTQDLIIKNALNDPCLITNPYEMSKKDMEIIYEKIIKEENYT